jgi:hypothetical protein
MRMLTFLLRRCPVKTQFDPLSLTDVHGLQFTQRATVKLESIE